MKLSNRWQGVVAGVGGGKREEARVTSLRRRLAWRTGREFIALIERASRAEESDGDVSRITVT